MFHGTMSQLKHCMCATLVCLGTRVETMLSFYFLVLFVAGTPSGGYFFNSRSSFRAQNGGDHGGGYRQKLLNSYSNFLQHQGHERFLWIRVSLIEKTLYLIAEALVKHSRYVVDYDYYLFWPEADYYYAMLCGQDGTVCACIYPLLNNTELHWPCLFAVSCGRHVWNFICVLVLSPGKLSLLCIGLIVSAFFFFFSFFNTYLNFGRHLYESDSLMSHPVNGPIVASLLGRHRFVLTLLHL